MREELLKTLTEEKEVLRQEVIVAREAAEITAQLVAKQFEETDRVLQLFQAANGQRKAVLDAASRVSIIATDAEGVVVLFNSGAENLLGYKADEVVGENTPLIFHLKSELAERNEKLSAEVGKKLGPLDIFFEYARLSGSEEMEWTYLKKDGKRFPVNMSITGLHDSAGRVNGILFVAMDITERKRAEQEILDAMRAAEDANKTKSAFLANMSHELRTPLNAIIGYSEMLQEEAAELEIQDFIPDLQKITSAGRHLLALINDILDLSKIEAGRMQVFLETFDLLSVVREVAMTIHPLVEKNSNTLKVNCPEDIGQMHADMTRVRQVLFNLLSNACKFTDKGVISLDVTREMVKDKAWLNFRVKDSGIGMTSEQMQKLFQAFSQADASTTRKYGGTGLGLAISRQFCNMLGGDITVESEYGSGTSFTARIPAEVVVEADAADVTTAPKPAVAQARAEGDPHVSNIVLAIDDDPAVLDLLTRNLSKDGFNVFVAKDGKEGVRLAKELRPVAITLDVMMPGMDGWAVLKELKADPVTRDIPVVMMTMVDDRSMGFALGATEYMMKPIDRNRLHDILARYRDTCEPGAVLVVEDDHTNRDLLTDMLKKAGLEVCEAENGRVALERVAAMKPALILLDLMMPEMDGFEFVEELRKNDAWRSIPIVVLTAKDVTEDDRRRLNGGVENIIRKGALTREDLMRNVCDQVSRSVASANEGQAGNA